MKLTEMWIKRMKEVLMSIYGDGLVEDKLEEYLRNIVKNKMKDKKITLKLRNLYERTFNEIDADNILNVVKENNLIIGANGTYVYSHKDRPSEISKILTENIANRDKQKEKEKAYETQGMFKLAKKHNTLQLKEKEDNNAIFGVTTQKGSCLFNVDSGGLITGQSAEMTSETLTGFEKILGGNAYCLTFNEAMLLFDDLKHCKKTGIHRNLITYIPTKRDIRLRLLRYLADTEKYLINAERLKKSLFIYTDNLSEEEMIYLYYKYNMKDLIFKNPLILNIFREILEIQELLINPYKIPDNYIPKINLLSEILFEYVIHMTPSPNRVYKYHNMPRKSVIVSDTDSNMCYYDNYVKGIYKATGIQENKENNYKIVNTLSSILTVYTDKIHERFVKSCNVTLPMNEITLKSKNEYYFSKMAVYRKVKKNYLALGELREGNKIPEAKRIMKVGIKTNSSTIHPYIKTLQDDIIENNILTDEEPSLVKIILKIEKAKEYIISQIKNGDISFGSSARFAGKDNYKDQGSVNCRTAEIWNRIYPQDTILPGDAMRMFSTFIYSKEDCYKIKDENIRNILIERIFSERYNDEINLLRKQGLKFFSVPRDGESLKIPDWIIPFINYEEMANKHLGPVIDIIPSIGGKHTKVKINNTKRNNFSTLMNF